VWQKSRRREDWVKYKPLGKETKRAISRAKFKRYKKLYARWGIKECEKEIYKLA